jgi:hypothetical protein
MFRRARQAGRRRRFGPNDPLPEPDDGFDFSDDDEDDPDEGPDGGLLAAAEEFSARTGVRLFAAIPDDDEEDVETQEAKGPVEARVGMRAMPVIGRAIMMYPTTIRGGLLRQLHLYGRFRMRGIPFLGCAQPKRARINLAIRRKTPPGQLQETLHHEIGHLIEMHPDFPAGRWEALNSHPYLGQGHRDREGKFRGEAVWSQGFISRYASKNRHEDFAELVEVAFTEPRRAHQLAREYPVIGAKLAFLDDTYARFAPGMSLPWR